VIGAGACFKLVAPYALLALALFEGLRLVAGGGREHRESVARALRRLGGCFAAAVAVFVGLLAMMDSVARPYDATAGKRLAAGPVHHLVHMFSYAADQTSPHGPRGIASYPWDWLVDYKPIVYLNINPAHPSTGLRGIHPAVHFLGMISPPIMLLALPGLLLAGWRLVRRVPSARCDVPVLGLAWFVATFGPFVALSLFWSYLYYMVVVMPGIYLVVGDLVFRWRYRRKLVGAWIVAVLAAAIVMYPFTPI
jgi:hypothetical protein